MGFIDFLFAGKLYMVFGSMDKTEKILKMRQTNRYGGKIFTIKEIVNVMPKLKGSRKEAISLGAKIGMTHNQVDVLRIMLGYTKQTLEKYDERTEKKACEIYKKNPDKSAYEIFRLYGEKIGLPDYQAYYKILKRNGLETNRKRDFWTPIKDKKLLYERDVKKTTWKDIQMMFQKSSGAIQSHYYTLKGLRRPRKKS